MKRLAYIDWMRGLACVLMSQTHCNDSWLNPAARKTALRVWSQLGGTLPAPLFTFLAGLSVALVTERLRQKGISRNAIAKQTILRGAEIFGLGLLFRLQEFGLGYPWSPWTDLLRVDILNLLGLAIILVSILCWFTGAPALLAPKVDPVRRSRNCSIIASLVTAALIAMLTPPLWTTWRPKFLPWALESYINGVHIFGKPQPWLFPIFPWTAFAFAGLAVGFFLLTDLTKRRETLAFLGLTVAGILTCYLSTLFDRSPIHLYAVYDYWHSSPNFLMMRCGILLLILFAVYAWCRWGFAQRGFSPMIQLGNTSLLVYWVHIEFVYGRFSIMPKGQCSILKATLGLIIIFLSMLALSVLRSRWKKWRAKASSRDSVPAPAAAES